MSEVIQLCKRQKVFATLSCPWHQGLLHAATRPLSDRVRTRLWRPSLMGAALREEGPSRAAAPGTGSYSYWYRLLALHNRYFYVFFFFIAVLLSTMSVLTDCWLQPKLAGCFNRHFGGFQDWLSRNRLQILTTVLYSTLKFSAFE